MNKKKTKQINRIITGLLVAVMVLSCVSFPAKAGSCASVTVEEQDNSAGTAKIVIRGAELSPEATGVSVPVWSQPDQSDLYWYAAETDAEGNYCVEVDIANHMNNYGKYYADVYDSGEKREISYLGGTTLTFEKEAEQEQPETQQPEEGQADEEQPAEEQLAAASVQPAAYGSDAVVVSDKNDAAGTAAITIKNVSFPEKPAGVRVAVWSRSDQSDLYWYTMKDIGSNSYTASMSLTNHKGNYGEYIMHVYGADSSGKEHFLGLTTAKFVKPDNAADSTVKNGYSKVVVSNKTGWFNITIDGSLIPQTVKSITVPVWSQPDQSDLIWYRAAKNSKGDYVVDVSVANHNYYIGKYYADIYTVNAAGAKSFLESKQITFAASGSAMNILTLDHRFYEFTVSDLQVPGGYTAGSFAVWSEEGGQDDLIWCDAQCNTSSGYITVKFDTNKLKHTGNVMIHSFVKLHNGKKQFVASGKFDYTGIKCNSVAFENKNDTAGTCTMRINGASAPDGIKNVKVAVWSQADQRDLHWYTAKSDENSNYSVVIDTANHNNNTGQYLADVYITDKTGTSTFVVSSKVTFGAPKQSVSIVNNNKQYEITLSGVHPSESVKSVRFALWTVEGGQDDLIWVDGVYSTDKKEYTAKFSDTKLLHDGKAFLDVYTKDVSGKSTCILSTTFDAQKGYDPAEAVAIRTDRKSGSFSIVIDKKAVGTGTASVKVPVWSKKDQSDLVWYTAKKNADGNYVVESNISAHKNNAGIYLADVYTYDSKGSKSYFVTGTMDFAVKYSEVKVEKEYNSVYKLTVSGLDVPGGVKGVRAAVWSVANGQDDLKWYNLAGSGSQFSVSIDLENHKSLGAYLIDVYADRTTGGSVYVATNNEIIREGETKAAVTVENVNTLNGTFDVRVEIANTQIKKVLVPTWTKADQSDLKWYEAEAVGTGVYKVRINSANHNDADGIYIVHVYGDFTDGSRRCIGSTEVPFEVNRTFAVSSADGSGTRKLSFKSSTAKNVRFAVWTKTGGQDDLVWYNAVPDGNGIFSAVVSSANHKHNGSYIVHVYADGKCVLWNGFSIIDYVEYALRVAANDTIGYSQVHRNMNPDVDCSSFVYFAVYNNGFASAVGTSPFTTASEVTLLKRAGFQVLNYTAMTDLKPGDILWYRRGTGHTEIYVGNGMMVGAHDSVVDGIDYPQGGDQTGREVSVGVFKNPGWMSVLRIYE